MLDTFSIFTTSGVVLWSRTWAAVPPSVINRFISDVFIEGRQPGRGHKAAENNASPSYRSDQHTLKYAVVKELGVIFVVVYRSLLQLSWIDGLVDNIRAIFVGLYGDQLRKTHTSVVTCDRFDEYFDQQLGSLDTTEKACAPEPDPPAADSSSPTSSRPSTPASASAPTPTLTPATATATAAAAKLSRRARRAQNAPVASSGDESVAAAAASRKKSRVPSAASVSSKTVPGKKKGRRWDADGGAAEADNHVQLDYSAKAGSKGDEKNSSNGHADGRNGHDGGGNGHENGIEGGGSAGALETVDTTAWGAAAAGKGRFAVRDIDDQVHSLLAEDRASRAAAVTKGRGGGGIVGSSLSTITSLFRNVVGGKVLTREDLEAPLKGVEEHLLEKNVAREAAVRLCESVGQELVGVRTAGFETIDARIRAAMETSLTKMLTPRSSLDLLHEIDAVARPAGPAAASARPYVISIVGVNGVGKSTNLSKIAFFLLQNRYRVMIAASDTFRSGAVEQLAVHVRNLSELAAREGGAEAKVELYQKGYGRDAAAVARDAVAAAARDRFDVVLVDTAGRRHNDQRLMSSLEKFATFVKPDKILMVGEALVGTDSVAQARNFDAAFGPGCGLSGFIISKCDTVGDMVGSIVSLVHATGVPVLFVGVGQHYSDLRNFSVKWAVEKLLA